MPAASTPAASTSGPGAASAAGTRHQLLDAALGILQRRSAAALTVRNIATEAGCSTTGIYTHFGGKNGLVEAIFLDGFDSFDRALAPAYNRGDLMAACLAYRRWALVNPTHYLVMFGRAVPDFVPSEPALIRARRSFDDLQRAVAERGAPDPEAAAFHLYACVHGYVMLELVGMIPGGVHDAEALYTDGVHRAAAQLL